MQEDNPSSLTKLPKGVAAPDMSDLPFQIDYFFVLTKQGQQKRAIPLTFRQTQTRFQTLLDQYLSATKYSVTDAKSYYFALNNGSRIDSKWEITNVLKMLGRGRMDGVLLYVQHSLMDLSKEDYDNQCAVLQYFEQNSPFYLRFQFALQGINNKEVIYVKCDPKDRGEFIAQAALEQFKKQFGIKDEGKSKLQIMGDIQFEDQKDNKIKFASHDALIMQKIHSGDTVYIKLKNPNKIVPKRAVQKQFNSCIVIYKQGEKQPIKLKYQDIYNLTFKDLYKEKLEMEGSEKKKDAIYCLKVMDKIVRPEQQMSKVEIYFINEKSIEVVGKVVNEKMIFYNTIPALWKNYKEFSLDQIVIPQDQQSKRDNCRKIIRKRAENASNEYFKKAEHIEPILIYTSELRYEDKETNNNQVIYVSLNKYLRERPILCLEEDTLNKQWRLRYASSLLKHLKNTKVFKGTVWRGVSYNPSIKQQDIGKIFTYKQFISTSTEKEKALTFSQPDPNGDRNLFEFTVKSGRSVAEYSEFEEGQVLLQPHTQFQLTKTENQVIDGDTYKVYCLNQVETSKELPGIKVNFVIWIDDKTDQNKQIYQKIKIPSEITIFEQISSTDRLKEWLQKNLWLLKEGTAKVIFITNMARKEGGKQNPMAGVEGARLIRNYGKELPIFFFIGYKKGANDKLVGSGLDMEHITVSDNPNEMQEYLKKHLTINK